MKPADPAAPLMIHAPAPHMLRAGGVNRILLTAAIALLPLLVVTAFGTGPRILLTAALSVAGCAAFDALLTTLFRNPGSLRDGSAVYTGLVLGLLLPPDAPLWLPLAAALIAMLFGKHLFGGLGFHLFNPALVSGLALIIFLPAVPLSGTNSPAALAAVFAGAALLIYRRYRPWQVPAAFLVSLALSAAILSHLLPLRFPHPFAYPLTPALFLGVLFLAGEPGTAPVTERGRFIFGTGCGLLTVIFSAAMGNACGFIPAILLMNFLTPLIDRTGYRERLENPEVPAFMKGAPLLLLTAAILAMALACL